MINALPCLGRRFPGLAGFVVLTLTLLAAPAAAEVVTRTVTYEQDGQTFEGYLAYDDAIEGERPGVLLIHEWWGLNDYAKGRARMLADLGYVAFAADMYGEGQVTADPSQASQWAGHLRQRPELWLGRAQLGLEQLKAQPQTDPERLAAIGYCFGGSTVIQLAYANADVDGIVSFHGSLPTAKEGARIQPRLLICHGAADAFVKPEQLLAFIEALNAAEADWTMIQYGDARHSFTNPGADEYGIDGVAYQHKADVRSWAHMKQFFRQLFGPNDHVGER